MYHLPEDIKQKIADLFPNLLEKSKVEKELIKLWSTTLNVGPEQLARSILVMSDGKMEEIKKIIESGFLGDPRDVIVAAENKMGNPNHYFIDHF